MIAIVDYGVGNIRSVINALNRAGVAEPVLTADRNLLLKADKVVLPGVGDASCAIVVSRMERRRAEKAAKTEVIE